MKQQQKHLDVDPFHNHDIVHALESAEKAMVHAVEEEVRLLFEDPDHDHHPHAKDKVHSGIQKAKAHVEDTHEKRRQWIQTGDQQSIDMLLDSSIE